MKYKFNKRTGSAYLKVYTSPKNPALPDDNEDFVVLECKMKEKFWKLSDQHLVTLPSTLVDKYFTDDAGVDFQRSHIEGE